MCNAWKASTRWVVYDEGDSSHRRAGSPVGTVPIGKTTSGLRGRRCAACAAWYSGQSHGCRLRQWPGYGPEACPREPGFCLLRSGASRLADAWVAWRRRLKSVARYWPDPVASFFAARRCCQNGHAGCQRLAVQGPAVPGGELKPGTRLAAGDVLGAKVGRKVGTGHTRAEGVAA